MCGQPILSNSSALWQGNIELCVQLAISVIVELANFVMDYTSGLKESETLSMTPWLWPEQRRRWSLTETGSWRRRRFILGTGIVKSSILDTLYELPMRHPKGNVKKAVGYISQAYRGGVKTIDLNGAFSLYPVASDPNTSSYSGMGSSLPLTLNALTAST